MPRVVVSLPTWRCSEYLRGAVESVLAQTYRDFVLVVVNDGDPDERFESLADIDDPRVVRFAKGWNHGCYFTHEVVRRAVAGRVELFAVQDADDVSATTRLERLVAAVDESQGGAGAASMIGGDYSGKSHDLQSRELARSFRHRYCHAGLWRMSALAAIGGYFGGFRIGWDSMLVSAMALYGETTAPRGSEPITWVPEELYTVRARAESLTRSPETCKGSEERNKVAFTYKTMWREMFARRDRLDVVDAIRNRMTRHVTPDQEASLVRESQALRALL